MPTPAQVRERAHAWRSAGAWTLVVGVFLALIAVIIAIMDVQLIGGSHAYAACGAVISPVPQVGRAIEACAAVLGEQTAWAAGWATIATALMVTGAVILIRTPGYPR